MTPNSGLRFRAYTILSRAVEEGVGHGIRRAYKHTDDPDKDSLVEHVHREVMNALDEILAFEEIND